MAVEVGRAAGAQQQIAFAAAEREPAVGLSPDRQTRPGAGLAVLIDIEIAEDGTKRVRSGRPADVRVRSDRDLEARARRPRRAKRFRIAIDQPCNGRRKARRLGRPQLAERRLIFAEHAEHRGKFESDAGRARFVVDDRTQQHRSVGRVLGSDQLLCAAKAGLGADVWVGVAGKDLVYFRCGLRIAIGLSVIG